MTANLRLNGTEFLDWAEVWCFRCEHDHAFSHDQDQGTGGCEIARDAYALGETRPELTDHAPDGPWSIPASISCASFKECGKCAPDTEDTERRWSNSGPDAMLVTRNEFAAMLRAETLAIPVVTHD